MSGSVHSGHNAQKCEWGHQRRRGIKQRSVCHSASLDFVRQQSWLIAGAIQIPGRLKVPRVKTLLGSHLPSFPEGHYLSAWVVPLFRFEAGIHRKTQEAGSPWWFISERANVNAFLWKELLFARMGTAVREHSSKIKVKVSGMLCVACHEVTIPKGSWFCLSVCAWWAQSTKGGASGYFHLHKDCILTELEMILDTI